MPYSDYRVDFEIKVDGEWFKQFSQSWGRNAKEAMRFWKRGVPKKVLANMRKIRVKRMNTTTGRALGG